MPRFWESLVPGWEHMTDEQILKALVERTTKPEAKEPKPVPAGTEPKRKRPASDVGKPFAVKTPAKKLLKPRPREPSGTPGWWLFLKWFLLRRYTVRNGREKYVFTPACVVGVWGLVVYVLYLLGFRL